MNKEILKLQAQIAKLYIHMRLKRITRLNWMMETEQTLKTLRELPQEDVSSDLFYVHYLITKQDIEEADRILEEAGEWLRFHSQEAPACHAYYLYLTTLLKENPEYDKRVTKKLLELSRKYPKIWQIQWLLFYVDASMAESALEQYHFLKGMFLKGCRSPLMYLEARNLMERNPSFLYEFSEFEVQLMVFMLRYAGISDRVSEILQAYMLQSSEYKYIYLWILKELYENDPSRRILEGIVRMLILGGHSGRKSLAWYRLAAGQDMRIPGLQEAYVKALPVEDWTLEEETEPLPESTLEYFAYSACPDDCRTAYLYALIHRDRYKYPDIYKLYEPLITPFMMDSLYKGKVNAGLAYLYEHVLQKSELRAEQAEQLLQIVYGCRICGLPVLNGILQLHYDHYEDIVEVPFEGGEATLPVFGSCLRFTVEDYTGYAYDVNEPKLTAFMQTGEWQDFLKAWKIEHLLYHMERAEEALKEHRVETEAESVKLLFPSPSISPYFKEELAEEILPYWDYNGAFEEVLAAAPYVFLEAGGYSSEKELQFWKRQYGNNRIGVYGMKFLMDQGGGSLLEQGGIFLKAKSLGMETGEYAALVLRNMMEQGQLLLQHEALLETALDGLEEPFLASYLAFAAGMHFESGKPMPELLIREMAKAAQKGHVFEIPERLAFLKTLAEQGLQNASEQVTETASAYIKEFLRNDIYFAWMQNLKAVCKELNGAEAFQVLEYRGSSDAPVWVRYTLYTGENAEPESLRSEIMHPVCEGLYTYAFLLFYGERVHYEIYGLEGTEQTLLGQGVLQSGQSYPEEGVSRFARLNQMLSMREKRENLELYREMEQFYRHSALAEQIFRLK